MRSLNKTATALVGEAKAAIENLTPAQVAAEIRRPGVVVIDLRERDEVVRDGMIAGAVHVPRGLLEFAADPASPGHHPGLDPARRAILHCAGGGRSALGAATLLSMGYRSVAHLDGGFAAWKANALPVITG